VARAPAADAAVETTIADSTISGLVATCLDCERELGDAHPTTIKVVDNLLFWGWCQPVSGVEHRQAAVAEVGQSSKHRPPAVLTQSLVGSQRCPGCLGSVCCARAPYPATVGIRPHDP
jgi:hypothetical protein